MPKEKPRISVIIPALEEENYIEAILSKLGKVNSIAEVIVVDGGSRDRTVKLSKRFTEKVYQTRKHGVAAGRNHGAQKASGDILVFLDADVTFPTNFAEKVLETFRDPTVVGATCNITPLQFQPSSATFFKVYNLMIRASIKFKPHSRGEFFAVRKSAFQSAKGFDETMPCLEDHDLAFRLSKLGRFVFISDLTVHESMRRFRKLGFWSVIGTWFVDYVSFMFRARPISPTWKPVR